MNSCSLTSMVRDQPTMFKMKPVEQGSPTGATAPADTFPGARQVFLEGGWE